MELTKARTYGLYGLDEYNWDGFTLLQKDIMKIKICWIERTIKIEWNKSDDDWSYWVASNRNKSITIYDNDKNKQNLSYCKYDVLLHEIMHAIIDETEHDNLFTDDQQEVICGLVQTHFRKILKENNFLKAFIK